MNIKTNYKHTLIAGYISFITQAIVNNFTPLLFITFQKDWDVSLSQLAFISTYNFVIQLVTDLIAARYADRVGVRRCIVFAHVCAAIGLSGLGIFPFILPSPYAGVIIAITFYAIGGGLIEVLTSPIIEACPTENKEAHMSLLHSFYCWGQMFAVLLSTLFFFAVGIENWRFMAYFWALIPAFNSIYFAMVPIVTVSQNDEKVQKTSDLFKNKLFYVLIVMMLCAGASELSIAQWASAFAEESLGISKTAGDILGPCLFAALMGISRVTYSKLSHRLNLEKYILFCAMLCVGGYLLTSLSPFPILSLVGCGICGYAVGIMWPGTYSIAAKNWYNPSTALFAMFALAGDTGCSTGPLLLGTVSQHFGDNLKTGVLAATVFPVVMIFAVIVLLRYIKKNKTEEN